MEPSTASTPDLAALFGSLSRPLERSVRREVSGCRDVVDDACQSAWTRLMRPGVTVGEGAELPWLITTARREAVRLARHADRAISLEKWIAARGATADRAECLVSAAPGPDEMAEHRDRLASLGRLPERQRRCLWLKACGYSYDEIATITGTSVRTVERQLLRARARMNRAQLDGV